MLVGDGKTDRSHALHAHARSHLQVVEFHVVRLRAVGTSQHEDVIIGHLLLLVCQFEELLIEFVEFVAIHLHTVHVQTMLQSGTTRTSRQHDSVVINAHFLGVHDFVGRCILQHTVLMDTAGVCKCVLAHNRLVRLHRHIHQRRHHAARRINLRRVDVRLDAKVGVRLENHRYLFQRRVTGTFADTVDGHLHLTGTSQHTSHRVCRRHAEVVVAVGREDGLASGKGIHVLVEVLDFLMILVRHAESRRVGDVANRRTCLGHGINHTSQILVVRATCILGIELHVLHILLGILHRSHSTFDDFLGSGVELVLDVRRTRTDTRVDTLPLRILQRVGCHVNVLLHRTSQCTDSRPCDRLRDFNHTVEIARAGDGESSLDDIHAQCLQLPCHLNLLNRVELTSWHLLAVAERRVENKQSVCHIFVNL